LMEAAHPRTPQGLEQEVAAARPRAPSGAGTGSSSNALGTGRRRGGKLVTELLRDRISQRFILKLLRIRVRQRLVLKPLRNRIRQWRSASSSSRTGTRAGTGCDSSLSSDPSRTEPETGA
ncbi:hypothetical protein ATANTOWER_026885, partial [Ataeniobius toweri]|nr:hypothetical protein [Ataeniobius toweri]